MARAEKQYEIVETKHRGGERVKRRLDFLGTLEDAKKIAIQEARKHIGRRYSIFPQEGFVAVFQIYYRTTVKCPKCGEIIPLE